jgi:hypothetical protein
VPKLEIEQIGRPEWPRWVIKDTIQQFFTGNNWTPDRKKALLFANRAVAEAECRRLHDDIVPQVFRVNLQIEMLSEQQISPDAILEYISRQIRLEIESDDEHPCSFARFDFTIDWDTFST